MTSPFADASVEIIADFSRFDEEFGRGLRARIKAATAGAGKEFDQLGAAAKRAGDTVTRNMRTAGGSVRASFAGGTREAVRDFDGIGAAARRVSVSVTADMRRAAANTRNAFTGAQGGAVRAFTQILVSARSAGRQIQDAFSPAAMRRLFDPLIVAARNAGESLRATFGPGLSRLFDAIGDASRRVSVRISTDLPAAAERVRTVFGSVFGTGPGGAIRLLDGVGTESETAGRRVTAAMQDAASGAAGSFGAIRDAGAGIFGGLATESAQSSDDVDVNLTRMKDRGALHFGDVSRSAELAAAEIVAAFRVAGAGISSALSVGNPFQAVTARAAVASQVIQRSMQVAALNMRRSMAQAAAATSRQFDQISAAARIAAARVGRVMASAGRDMREAFRQTANPFILLIARAGDAAKEVLSKFRGVGRTVASEVSPRSDPFTGLIAFAARAARIIEQEFRNIGRRLADDFTPPADPFDRMIQDATRAADQIGEKFRQVGRNIAGDLGPGVEDPFNVISRRASDAARQVENQFEGMGRRIFRDLNPEGDPFDGLRRQSAAASRDIKSDMRGVAGAITTVAAVSAGAAAITGGIGLLAGGLAHLAAMAAGAVAALTPLAGAILALPALGAVGATAIGTLTVGFSGMDKILDSLTKDKPKDFEKAIAKMSGSARAFALELRKLQKPFDDLKTAVQGELFAGLVPVLDAVAKNLLPVLKAGLVAMAGVFNTLAKNLGAFLSDSRTASVLSDVFANAATAMGNLAEAAVPVAKAILGLVAAGGPGVLRIADAIRRMAERFADFVDQGTKSGQIAKFIDNGITAIGKLIDITKDFGGIIAGVFKAAGGDSKTLLSDIGDVVASMRELVESPEGQRALHDFFEGVREIIAVTLPVFRQLAPIVATVTKMIGDLTKGMGSGLQTGLAALGRGLEKLTPAAQPVGEALGSIFEALGRVAEVLGPALAEFLIAAAPYIDEMATITADILVPLIRELTPLIGPMVRALGEMALGFLYIVEVIGIVRKPLTDLFINVLIPIMKDVQDLARMIKEPFKELSELLFFTDWDEILAPLKKVLDQDLPGTFLNAVTSARNFGPDLISGIRQGIDDRLNELREAAARIARAFVDRLKEVLGIASPSAVMARIGGQIIDGLIAGLRGASARVGAVMGAVAGSFYGWATALPGRMAGIGGQIIGGLVGGLKRGAAAVRDAVAGLAALIPSGIARLLDSHSPSRVTFRLGETAVDGLRLALVSGRAQIRAAVDDLAAEVTRNLGAPVIGAAVMPAPVITAAAVAAAAAVVPRAAPVTPVVPVQRAAPVVAPGGLTPSALAGAGAGLTVVNNIALPTGDPLAAAQTIVNRVAASVLAGGA
jgi:hypothetical protein